METHADDPIDAAEADSGPETDPWDRMAEQVSSLGRKLRDTYQRSVGEDGPDQAEIKAALRTLGNAWEKLAQAVGAAARDEEVRDNMKNAATGFFEAVGAAFSELGSELRRSNASDQTAEKTGSRGSIAEGDIESTAVVEDAPVARSEDDG